MSAYPSPFSAAGDGSTLNEQQQRDAFSDSEPPLRRTQEPSTNPLDHAQQPAAEAEGNPEAPIRTKGQLESLFRNHPEAALRAIFYEMYQGNDKSQTIQTIFRNAELVERLEDAFVFVEADGITDHLRQPQPPTPESLRDDHASGSAARAPSVQLQRGMKRGSDEIDLREDDDEEPSTSRLSKKQRTKTMNRAPAKPQGKVQDPKKSTRRPALAGKAPKFQHMIDENGRSVHFDKKGNKKRGIGTNRKWDEIPSGRALLEAYGAFANLGEPTVSFEDVIDDALRLMPEIDINTLDDEDYKEVKTYAKNTHNKRRKTEIKKFFNAIDTADYNEDELSWFEQERKVFNNYVKSVKGKPNDFCPFGLLRAFLTDEQLQERDNAFAQAQQLSFTVTFGMDILQHPRFPHLQIPRPVAATTPAAGDSASYGSSPQDSEQTFGEETPADVDDGTDDGLGEEADIGDFLDPSLWERS